MLTVTLVKLLLHNVPIVDTRANKKAVYLMGIDVFIKIPFYW